jgi:hypothetical protein
MLPGKVELGLSQLPSRQLVREPLLAPSAIHSSVVYNIMISRFFSNKETAQLQKADTLGVFPHVESAVI